MPISESSVSILMPTYNNAPLAERALISALKSNAGEIIICDDKSCDNTFNLLSKYKDSRINISRNNKNIGLWENHLRALRLATLDWIKFLQQDDVILEGGLNAFCEQADDDTAIIGSLPIFQDLENGVREIPQTLTKPKRWNSEEYLERITKVGFELGNPSMTLIRKDTLELNERAWQTDISADYLMHVICPTKGDVVIIPPGPIVLGIHKNQESQTANFSLSVKRMANTLYFLSEYPNTKLRLHSHLVAVIESFGFLIYAVGQLKNNGKLYKNFFKEWANIAKLINPLDAFLNIHKIIALFKTKYFGRNKNLDIA